MWRRRRIRAVQILRCCRNTERPWTPSRALCCGGQNDAPQPTRLRPDVRRVAVEPSTANPSPTKRSLAGRNFVATYRASLARLKKNSTLRWEKNCSGRIVHPHNRLVHRIIVKRLRSEEHTSELQSRVDLVCRLLLEKK